MAKKNERMCWNCHGSVSFVLSQCPYCGVELGPADAASEDSVDRIDAFASPFQRKNNEDNASLTPPYSSEFAVSDDEWNAAIDPAQTPTPANSVGGSEMTALLLLLPGVVFFLFGLALLLFSDRGMLTLHWNASFAYFYFVGAIPLLFLGWKFLK